MIKSMQVIQDYLKMVYCKMEYLKTFQDSPVTKDILVKDICIYAPGDLNKIGKEGKQAGIVLVMQYRWHTTYGTLPNAVQEANRCYDNGIYPAMLVQEKFDRLYFRDVIDAIFSTSDRGKAEAIIEEYPKIPDVPFRH